MKKYFMLYHGDNDVAAALDDLLAYCHAKASFKEPINMESVTVQKAIRVLTEANETKGA